jgi:hypothetical protein
MRSTACDLTASVADYCYKGRVQDDLALSSAIALSDSWRCKPCPLTLGGGFYYTLPYTPEDWCEGTGNCINPNSTNYANKSDLEKQLARVLAFASASLRFTADHYLNETHISNRGEVAIRRPTLDITKDNLHFPGHRHATMNKLESDFTHPTWTLRPWDDILHVLCPEDAPANITLDSSIEIDTNGDETLVYDQNIPLTYYGNGLTPDIPSLGDHTDNSSEPAFVTHSIYTSQPSSPYVELEGVVHSEDVAETTDGRPTTICIPSEVGKIFTSASDGYDAEDVLVTGLGVAYLFNETSGDAIDSTDNPVNLAEGGTVTRLDDGFFRAAVFTSADGDEFGTTSVPKLAYANGNDFTISFWLKMNSSLPTGNTQIIEWESSVGGEGASYLQLRSGGGTIRQQCVRASGANDNQDHAVSLSADTWYHIGWRYSESDTRARLYISENTFGDILNEGTNFLSGGLRAITSAQVQIADSVTGTGTMWDNDYFAQVYIWPALDIGVSELERLFGNGAGLELF